ncbi:hypothetical protein CDL15_Pgr009498 [Punica granatum]|uniref:Uncharacterized protein n=1 Tax=Punica granatum TaxID=22663 RepID=A0A218WSL1_PUNGR|nr:hypothetical protein CDL15_Pgr009498 [Punica granatum]
MNMENMLLLMLAVYSHIANSSSAPEEEGDEEAPPPALDPVEAAPPPPLAQHMGPRLDSPFASTSGTSSYTAPSGASARLSRDVDVELALGAAHRSLLGSPRPECPVPSAAPHSAPSPLSMQQQGPTSGSNTNVAGDPQAVRLRLYLPPGWVGSDSPPLCHVIDIEMATTDQRRHRVPSPVYLGETFLGLTYQAVVALVVFHFQSTSNDNISSKEPPKGMLLAAEVAVVVGFAASLIGILLREVCWKVATNMERAGSVSAAAGFFLMMGMLSKSTTISQWIGWLCGGASFVAFILSFIKKKRE